MLRLRSILACVGALVVAAPPSAADSFPRDFEEPAPPPIDPYSYAWRDPRMPSGVGVGVMFGAGVTGFSGDMRDLVNRTVGWAWNVRFAIGTHIPLGVELGYFGSIAKLQTLMDDFNGMLLGTTLEATLRWTILPLANGTPYVFAGAGWQRFGVKHAQFPQADTGLGVSASCGEFPIGAGMAYRHSDGWVGDVRATFRPTQTTTLITQPNGDGVRLDSWEASAAIGYEF
jgi:hypothetical protein